VAYSTTDTFASLIDEVITSLQGYGVANDQVATLTSSIGTTDLSFTVDSTDNVSRGLIEIDTEIMYVDHGENGTVYVPAWGRGFKGTTAEAHASGVAVWISPTWPRATVAREVNNTIRSIYPDVFAVAATDIFNDSLTWQYVLPVDCERVLGVEWTWDYPNAWNTVKNWEMTHSAPAGEYPTGNSLLVGDAVPNSSRLRVTYAKIPTLLSLPSQEFTETGLPASCRDLVVLGTAARLVPWQDTSRLPVETVPSDVQDQTKPVGLASQVAATLRQQYNIKLATERRALLDKYPTRAHGVR
jgi:hypothetical protein